MRVPPLRRRLRARSVPVAQAPEPEPTRAVVVVADVAAGVVVVHAKAPGSNPGRRRWVRWASPTR